MATGVPGVDITAARVGHVDVAPGEATELGPETWRRLEVDYDVMGRPARAVAVDAVLVVAAPLQPAIWSGCRGRARRIREAAIWRPADG